MPNVLKITLKQAYETSPRFKQFVHSEVQFEKLYTLACQLEGLPRHTSTHAAGIVMSRYALDEVIPLIKNSEGIYLTGYSMEYLEEIGLLKMDFLGLKNLTTIMNIIDDIEKNENIKIDFLSKIFIMQCNMTLCNYNNT